ncbi:MAG: L-seryl-tRNA(Sec) selenium transferase [Kofleriaceae bacterium]|nr:L-seryl-tRNA(Sec) selenium transferase [Kofleriaceae bacterium]
MLPSGAVSASTRDDLLRRLPAVHELAAAAAPLGAAPRWAVVEAARRAVAARRAAILAGAGGDGADDGDGAVADAALTPAAVAVAAATLARSPLRRVVNATGVVLHTNLGRAPLAPAAVAAVAEVATGYSTLEYDLEAGARGSRHGHAAGLLRELTGAEDALVVNNCAAACLLALSTLAAGGEVVVSRGELVEIGGSFRVPDILRQSGARLVEVGTTNKTRRGDYEAAIGDATALLLKVHPSNFAMVGFTEATPLAALVELARGRGVASMIDLGSGALAPGAELHALGLGAEPSVREVVATGVDLVCFSGDKLLGGPQAGVLVGRADVIARCRRHPLLRALRPDKLTLAALVATLALYREGRPRDVPALAMLAAAPDALAARAHALRAACGEVAGVRLAVEAVASTVGGGALPTIALPSWALTIDGAAGATAVDAALRAAAVPVIGRVADGRVVLDLRTIAAADEAAVVEAIQGLAT